MKTLICLLIGAMLAATPGAGSAAAMLAWTMTREAPFACNVAALSPAERKRHFDELGPALRALKTGMRELPNGYAFRLPGDAKTLQLAAEWAAGERACCPFFDIDLKLEREGGPLWLTLSGREGTKQFIEADGAAWIGR
jgi:hypothetical protein